MTCFETDYALFIQSIDSYTTGDVEAAVRELLAAYLSRTSSLSSPVKPDEVFCIEPANNVALVRSVDLRRDSVKQVPVSFDSKAIGKLLLPELAKNLGKFRDFQVGDPSRDCPLPQLAYQPAKFLKFLMDLFQCPTEINRLRISVVGFRELTFRAVGCQPTHVVHFDRGNLNSDRSQLRGLDLGFLSGEATFSVAKSVPLTNGGRSVSIASSKVEFDHSSNKAVILLRCNALAGSDVCQHCQITYKLFIYYSSIQSIMVDLNADSNIFGDNPRTASLYLELACPLSLSESSRKRNPADKKSCLSCVSSPTSIRGCELVPADVIANSNVVRLNIATGSEIDKSQRRQTASVRNGYTESENDRRRLTRSDSDERVTSTWSFFELVTRLCLKTEKQPVFHKMRRQECGTDGDSYTVPQAVLEGVECSEMDGFAVEYAWQCLLSRGYRVTRLVSQQFVERLRSEVVLAGGFHRVTSALSEMVGELDSHGFIFDFDGAFARILEAVEACPPTVRRIKNSVLVRKLIVTPYRLIFEPPMEMMMNRVVREFGPENFIRVVVRSDNMDFLYPDSIAKMEKDWMEGRLRVLENGVEIGGRQFEFLGWSNSQLREHGFYMMAKAKYTPVSEKPRMVDASYVRGWMGELTKPAILSVYMSRMGQCFTQSAPVFEVKKSEMYETLDDVQNRDGSIFSDGVGWISEEKAVEVAKQLGLVREGHREIPSAYQVRFAGCKGMLAVKKGMRDGKHFAFRQSQVKFKTETSCMLELVKFSRPREVGLNRPLISILDQVSAHSVNGSKVHRRVSAGIKALLEETLFSVVAMLMEERMCVEALIQKVPLPLKFDEMSAHGLLIRLSDEPFFRSLLLAVHTRLITDLAHKMSIPLSVDKGRMMYGILDEEKLLMDGQVFIKVSESIKHPQQETRVITGRVMVTKNPCTAGGDVRILEAVNLDRKLGHLVDVIVFSQFGDKSESSKMAGSDLDGDEFAVFWLSDIMVDKHVPYESYDRPETHEPPIERPPEVRDMVSFLSGYMRKDQLKRIARWHLAVSDHKGIFSPEAKELAAMHSIAVDFQKWGIDPDPDGSRLEAARSDVVPDFIGGRMDGCLKYRSERLLGELHRMMYAVKETALKHAQEVSHLVITPDLNMTVDGWESYRSDALKQRSRYEMQLRQVMSTYGVAHEAELLSCHLNVARKRISERERDDFSYFTTERMIKMKVHQIWFDFRAEFLRQFAISLPAASTSEPVNGGNHAESEFGEELNPKLMELLGPLPEQTEHDEDKVDNNLTETGPFWDEHGIEMKKKASAWYMVTYDDASDKGIISFPWIVWDVLAAIKRDNVSADRTEAPCDESQKDNVSAKRAFAACELHERLSAEMKERVVDVASLRNTLSDIAIYSPVVQLYLRTVKDFQNIAYYVARWLPHSFAQPRPVEAPPGIPQRVRKPEMESAYALLVFLHFCWNVLPKQVEEDNFKGFIPFPSLEVVRNFKHRQDEAGNLLPTRLRALQSCRKRHDRGMTEHLTISNSGFLVTQWLKWLSRDRVRVQLDEGSLDRIVLEELEQIGLNSRELASFHRLLRVSAFATYHHMALTSNFAFFLDPNSQGCRKEEEGRPVRIKWDTVGAGGLIDDTGVRQKFVDTIVKWSGVSELRVVQEMVKRPGVVVKSSAKTRRERENAEFLELGHLLPLPNAITAQLDKASILRIATSYLQMKRNSDLCQMGQPSSQSEKGLPPEYQDELSSALVQSLDGFVALCSADKKVFYVTEPASVHLGFSQADLIGFGLCAFMDESDFAELLSKMDSGADFIIQTRMRCSLPKRNAGMTCDDWKAMEVSGHLITHGRSPCHALYFRPFPPGLDTEIRLHSDVCLIRLSLDGKFIFLDSRFPQWTEYDSAELIDQSIFRYIYPDDVQAFSKAFTTAIKKDQAGTDYFRIVAQSGEMVTFWAQIITIRQNRNLSNACITLILHMISSPRRARASYEADASSASCYSTRYYPSFTPNTK